MDVPFLQTCRWNFSINHRHQKDEKTKAKESEQEIISVISHLKLCRYRFLPLQFYVVDISFSAFFNVADKGGKIDRFF